MDFFQIVPKEINPVLFSVILLMPFWYVALYLLKRDFYKNSAPILRWTFAFCFSVIWYIPFFIIELMSDAIRDQNTSLNNLYLITFTLSATILSMFIFRTYTKKREFIKSLVSALFTLGLFVIAGIIIALAIHKY